MLHEERHNHILSEIAVKGAVKVTELAKALGTSESTIRRDITELAEQGRLRKVFGGAVALERSVKTVAEHMKSKANVRVKEKDSIARYAASLLSDNDFVFIDAGTTTEKMIDYIDNPTVTFVTNGITHGKKLSEKGLKVYMTGGKLKPDTWSIVGIEAVSFLNKCNFTKCFMGANGIDPERGFTTPNMDEALLKAEAMKRAENVYILADGSKFGCISAASFGKLEDACVITDKLIEQDFRRYTIVKETEADAI
jgi:DeoR family fructose operon transcriptional repressor